MKFVTNARRGVAGRETYASGIRASGETIPVLCPAGAEGGGGMEGEGGEEPCPGSRTVVE